MKHLTRLLTLLVILGLLTAVEATSTPEEEILHSCTYGETVYLLDYTLDEEQLDQLFVSMTDSGQLPWYTTARYQYTYNEDTHRIYSFTPVNLTEEYDRTLYEQKLAELMDACIHPGMTEEEIALSVHDYIIATGSYDTSLMAELGYDLLIDGTGICSAYTALYRDILNRAGIPCVSVSSDPMAHTWNLVNISGSWYHVDLTWDDPTPDIPGYVSHAYFLLTDEEISQGEDPHYDWQADITCNDNRFSTAYWKPVESQMIFPGDGFVYYLETRDFDTAQAGQDLSNLVRQKDLSTGSVKTLYTDLPQFIDLGEGEYLYAHLGLSWQDGRLYFNTLDRVLSLGEGETEPRTEYSWDVTEHKQYLYCSRVAEDQLLLTLCDPAGNYETLAAPLESYAPGHRHSYTLTQITATCTDPGYTVSTCDCGLSCRSLQYLADHSYGEDGLCTLCGHDSGEHQGPSLSDPTSFLEGLSLTPLFLGGGAILGVGLILLVMKRK